MKYVVFDIDGCLADITDLLPLWDTDREQFYARLGEAKLIKKVADIFYGLSHTNFTRVIYTSKPEKTRTVTETWLTERWLMPYDVESILMRENGDSRHDSLVKLEMLEKAGLTPDNVLLIVEDRTCVVKALRQKGFTVLQPFDNDY